MSDYSAQGSITVKRLRSGDTITLSFSQNKIPLYQSVDTDTGSVSPDWSVAANQPTVTPSLTSARGNSVSLVRFTWKWNGTNVEEYPALFSVDSTTGALTITGNLASTENYANDVLTFTCTARCAGVEYTFERAIDVVITKKGASSYEGFVTADYTTISTEHETATATLSLFLGETQLSEYFVKWYKGSIDTPFVPVGSSTQATNTVTSSGGDTRTFGRADVDGTALFIAEFYLSASDTNPVTCAALRIVDASDEYNVVFGIVSGTQVDDSSSVVVQANLVNNRTGNSITSGLSAITWKLEVLRMQDDEWNELRESEYTDTYSPQETITVEDTDYTDSSGNAVTADVEVVATVEFTI